MAITQRIHLAQGLAKDFIGQVIVVQYLTVSSEIGEGPKVYLTRSDRML